VINLTGVSGFKGEDYRHLDIRNYRNDSFRRNFDIHHIVLGLDLGQAKDYSALSIVRRTIHADDTRSGCITPNEIKYLSPVYYLLYMKRYRLHSSYIEICRDIKRIINEGWPGEEEKPYLVIDYGGPGRPVLDIFREEGLKPFGIQFTAGNRRKSIPGGMAVPKRDIVSSLLAAFQKGELKIPQKLPEKKALLKELSNFKIKVSDKGNDIYEHAKSSDHDDMVLSLAMAIYWFRLISKDNWHAIIRKMN
jgi:hypothetical protein